MTAKVSHKTSDAFGEKLDVLAFLFFENEKPTSVKKLDQHTQRAAGMVEKRGDFKGKLREQVVLYTKTGTPLLLTGLGKREKVTREAVRKATGAVVQKALALRARSLGVVLTGTQIESALHADVMYAAGAVADAAVMASYKFERFKTERDEAGGDKTNGTRAPKKASSELNVSIFTNKNAKNAAREIERSVAIAQGANLTRDIANEPANVATPTRLATLATEMGKKNGLKVSVLDRAEMKKLGMGALLAVAQGSEEPPKFIIMDYDGTKGASKNGASKEVFCLVGKGITFDSGGISIKPADKMWEMKFDKCGGCAVIGAMEAIAKTKLPARVIGIVPATENLPSGKATKPGDVVRAMSGKTIEIQNTDAEGRLILADALHYSQRYEPSVIIDMATLTGACVVALGEVRAGLFGNDEKLLADLKLAGDRMGEKVWPMPLDDEYGDHIKSESADLKNLGRAGHAGAISAAYFLKHFAPAKAKWAHIDMAGTAWGNEGRGYIGKGATGFGVRLVLEYLRAALAPKKTDKAAGKKKKKAKAAR